MFTDIVGYTSLAQTDEASALRLLDEQQRLVRPILETHHGRQVKMMGDGLLLEFHNALDAVEFGVELQRRLHERNTRKNRPPLEVRVGIHLGDVQRKGSDIVGDAVNVASRVEPVADVGGVCLSFQVYDQVHNKVSYPFEKLGPRSLRGVRESVDLYRIIFPWSRAREPSIEPLLPRLAVLPLTNISPDPKDEYFAEGLSEELISVLSQIGGLRVIARTSVGQYRGTTKSIGQIGSELGVSSVLEGSVRKSGNQLRITVQLIDVRTQEHRWAQTYDRTLENVFAIQAEVAERTASALKIELLKSEREAVGERPTRSAGAYEWYLRGIQAARRFEERTSKDTDLEAARHFEIAIREDPQFAAAYAQYADHLIIAGGDTRSWEEAAGRIRELVTKALELNPNSSAAHGARGALAAQVDHDWSGAEREFQQAIALNPSNTESRTRYGWLLRVLQRFKDAKKEILRAIEQDPLGYGPRASLAWTYAEEGNTEMSISLGEDVLKDYPDAINLRGSLATWYAAAGRAEDALHTIEPLGNSSDEYSRLYHCSVLAFLGKPEEARAYLADWEGGRLPEEFDITYIAMLCAQLGEHERALALIEAEDRQGGRDVWWFYQWMAFDPIRDDSRFMALLRGLNLPTTLARSWRYFPRLSRS